MTDIMDRLVACGVKPEDVPYVAKFTKPEKRFLFEAGIYGHDALRELVSIIEAKDATLAATIRAFEVLKQRADRAEAERDSAYPRRSSRLGRWPE